mmetsp:Transcript_534/g.1613  ORF Transcript_534/g.1613 Transcript_534/m.1613 type:complete len:196 (+) Transcript_534:279-866(+)
MLDSRGDILVDERKHIEARDLSGGEKSLALGLRKIRRNSDDAVGDFRLDVGSRHALDVSENHAHDLLRAKKLLIVGALVHGNAEAAGLLVRDELIVDDERVAKVLDLLAVLGDAEQIARAHEDMRRVARRETKRVSVIKAATAVQAQDVGRLALAVSVEDDVEGLGRLHVGHFDKVCAKVDAQDGGRSGTMCQKR